LNGLKQATLAAARLHDDLPQPLVTRVFNIMARNDLIPPLPSGVDGNGLQVEFISILDQAQKAVATVGIEHPLLQFQLGLIICRTLP
jgi:hypothetical protein